MLSLSVSSACLSVCCCLRSTSGNWEWAIKCSQACATWEEWCIALRFITTRQFPHWCDESVWNISTETRVHKVTLWHGCAAASSVFLSTWDATHRTVNSINSVPQSTWCNKPLWRLLTVAAGAAALPQSLICRFSLSRFACLNSHLILEPNFTPNVLKWKRVVFHFYFPLLSHLPRSLPFLWILCHPPPCSLLWGMRM